MFPLLLEALCVSYLTNLFCFFVFLFFYISTEIVSFCLFWGVLSNTISLRRNPIQWGHVIHLTSGTLSLLVIFLYFCWFGQTYPLSPGSKWTHNVLLWSDLQIKEKQTKGPHFPNDIILLTGITFFFGHFSSKFKLCHHSQHYSFSCKHMFFLIINILCMASVWSLFCWPG